MFESCLAPAARAAAALSAALLLAPAPVPAASTTQAGGAAASALPLPRPRHGDGSIVKRGDANGTVRKVQRVLGVDADGVFGPRTARAVRGFQARSRLPRTGEVDARTWRALFRAPVTAAAPAASACGGPLVAPVIGTRTSGFGDGRHHTGIDVAAPVGSAVRAASCGTVTLAGARSGYGRIVCIEHSAALTTCYAHLSTRAVATGAYVAAGQLVGRVGMTGRTSGPHLHFEVRVHGQARDPQPYLAGAPTG